jgi:hypothetical protein
VLCVYFRGLNLSNHQIALELGLDASDTQIMTEQLRHGLVAKMPAATLEGDLEIDEVYVVAGHIGHKRACALGQPAAVAKGGDACVGAGWRARRDAVNATDRNLDLPHLPCCRCAGSRAQAVLWRSQVGVST